MGKASLTIPKEITDNEMNELPMFIENEKKDDPARKIAGDSDEKGELDVEEETEPKEEPQEDDKKKGKELTFWSGFVDSLSMIFFVEFGDRVSL